MPRARKLSPIWYRSPFLPGIRRSIMQQAALSDRYVDFANHCLQLAAKTTDERSRRILREMATKWLELAEVTLAG
jgi:hypothetical protein